MFDKNLVRQFRELKTPFYYYDLDLIAETLDEINKHAFSRGFHVHFALKANNNDPILQMMQKAGLGADCVSGEEIEKAVGAGFDPSKIAFAGVGKSDPEMETGLRNDIFSFNCESAQELEALNELAGKLGKQARIALRINPNLEAGTHRYITTGTDDNKFGIPSEFLPGILDSLDRFKNLKLTGMHVHIGSQIENFKVFEAMCGRINNLKSFFTERGFKLQHINVGGGFGICYNAPDHHPIPDFKNYFELFDQHLERDRGEEIHFELGRSLVGQSGSLISKVLFTKQGRNTHFAIIDAGMTELIRPALYQARHHIEVLTSNRPNRTYTVAGPICETADTFRTGISMPEVKRGDLLAIRSCGAYGQVMSSDYNLRERAKAYYSSDF